MRQWKILRWVAVLASLVTACAEEKGPAPFVEGTCVTTSYCVYPNSYHREYSPGDTWCVSSVQEDGTPGQVLHPIRSDGSYVSCESLGFPIECSNCTGRDFFYKEGKVCKRCDGGSSSGSSGGSSGSGCDYSGCLQTCFNAGGSNCGEACKCD